MSTEQKEVKGNLEGIVNNNRANDLQVLEGPTLRHLPKWIQAQFKEAGANLDYPIDKPQLLHPFISVPSLPLVWAITIQRPDIYMALLDAGADPNCGSSGNAVINNAPATVFISIFVVGFYITEKFNYILPLLTHPRASSKFNPNSITYWLGCFEPILNVAIDFCLHGNVEGFRNALCTNLMNLLNFPNINVKASGSTGNTPLHVLLGGRGNGDFGGLNVHQDWLMKHEQWIEVLKILLRKGAKANVKNNAGKTPLLVFLENFNAGNEQPPVVQADVQVQAGIQAQAGAEVQVQDQGAAQAQNLNREQPVQAQPQVFANGQAQPQVQAPNNPAPVSKMPFYILALEILLRMPQDIDLKTVGSDGKTALMLAIEKGNNIIIQVLKNFIIETSLIRAWKMKQKSVNVDVKDIEQSLTEYVMQHAIHINNENNTNRSEDQLKQLLELYENTSYFLKAQVLPEIMKALKYNRQKPSSDELNLRTAENPSASSLSSYSCALFFHKDDEELALRFLLNAIKTDEYFIHIPALLSYAIQQLKNNYSNKNDNANTLGDTDNLNVKFCEKINDLFFKLIHQCVVSDNEDALYAILMYINNPPSEFEDILTSTAVSLPEIYRRSVGQHTLLSAIVQSRLVDVFFDYSLFPIQNWLWYKRARLLSVHENAEVVNNGREEENSLSLRESKENALQPVAATKFLLFNPLNTQINTQGLQNSQMKHLMKFVQDSLPPSLPAYTLSNLRDKFKTQHFQSQLTQITKEYPMVLFSMNTLSKKRILKPGGKAGEITTLPVEIAAHICEFVESTNIAKSHPGILKLFLECAELESRLISSKSKNR